MNPATAPAPVAPQPQSDGSDINQMVVLQPGEQVICQIKRHPFGLIGQYIVTGFLIVLAAAAALFVVPQLNNNYDTQGAAVFIYAALGLLAVIALAFLAASSSIYWKNRWIVTSDSLTQILQPSLFGQQVSQLSLDDLEDVTVIQNGMIQAMFDFGTLKAETAGERSKFVFPYCPAPKAYARKILEAREEFMNYKRYNESAQHAPAYYAPQQSAQPPVSDNSEPPAFMPPSSRP